MKNFYLSLAFSSVLAASSQAFSYTNDFESAVGGEWSSSTQSTFSGTGVLGRFDNQAVSLTLTGLTVGTVVTAKFDFYALDSWDGNNTSFGPDRFKFSIDGGTLLDTTFSNVGGFDQSYPNGYLSGSFAPQTGADNVDVSHGGTLDNGYFGNALYRFSGGLNPDFVTVASSSTMVLTWEGSGLQGVGDESWAIDNVSVTATPEPATCLFLAAGIAALRARRAKK